MFSDMLSPLSPVPKCLGGICYLTFVKTAVLLLFDFVFVARSCRQNLFMYKMVCSLRCLSLSCPVYYFTDSTYDS